MPVYRLAGRGVGYRIGHTSQVSVSVFELFKIGIGPSSSHTVGPMKAAAAFARSIVDEDPQVSGVRAELFGSLGATGHGHGSEQAVLLGLEGADPRTVDVVAGPKRVEEIRSTGRLMLGGRYEIAFDVDDDLILHRHRSLPGHPNGMLFTAFAGRDAIIERTYYSIGGGFVLEDDGSGRLELKPDPTPVPYPFRTGADLLKVTSEHRLTIPELMFANECARRTEAEVRSGLAEIWMVMQECVANGCNTSGVLPGGLRVRRRAARLYKDLCREKHTDPLTAVDWLTLWALAVNEENAAGGRVVTAPTNGAAGIIPSTLHYVMRFVEGCGEQTVIDFLLTAGAIGAVFQQTASISGAEVGCQGEVGTACAMASAAVCQVLGGNVPQVINAAEIGLEHNLGLTCDPVGGLVQIPCIERNAVASVKAVTAARLARSGDGYQIVSLDQVVKTMMQTGHDMKVKYKETARGGLAVNIVEC